MALLLAAVVGCGAPRPATEAAEVPVAPTPSAAPTTAAPVDPFAVAGPLSQERLPAEPPGMPLRKLRFPKAAAGVPAAPAACRAFVARRGTTSPACADRPSSLAALARALAEPDRDRQDEQLVSLEGCAGLPVGFVRALRAELAAVECGDGLVEPLLRRPPDGLDGVIHDALFGLGIAARLARTVQSPPRLEPPHDKARVEAFHKGPLLTWGTAQARAVQDMSALGAELGYYGKAVVAVEAGMADMRFVDVVRSLPVPEEYAGDQELADEYYGSLDVALEPRKSRGRDAALVGLRGLAYVGAIADPRVERARALLSRMYGGRPIDALDHLLLPPRDPAAPPTVAAQLAAQLPTLYAGLVLEPALATDVEVLAAFCRRGVPLPHRIALRAATLTEPVRLLLGRARLELGRTYWRAVDVDEAVAVLAAWPAGSVRPPAGDLLLAIALALRGGPADAAEMIRTAPLESLGIGRVDALDALAEQRSPQPLAALAAFDGALIRQIAAPPRAPAAYWRALAERYRRAGSLLTAPADKQLAADRARDAEATARAIR